MNTFAKSVDKFFYYSLNYEYDTVKIDVWGETQEMLLPKFFNADFTCNKRYLAKKWHSIEQTDSYGRLNRFYAGLDYKNREILLNWIDENYEC